MDVFPLQNPDAGRAEADALWQKQYDALFALLSDGAPAVRAVAVQGVCKVLSVFWEVIPPTTAKSFLVKLVDDLVGGVPPVIIGSVLLNVCVSVCLRPVCLVCGSVFVFVLASSPLAVFAAWNCA